MTPSKYVSSDFGEDVLVGEDDGEDEDVEGDLVVLILSEGRCYVILAVVYIYMYVLLG